MPTWRPASSNHPLKPCHRQPMAIRRPLYRRSPGCNTPWSRAYLSIVVLPNNLSQITMQYYIRQTISQEIYSRKQTSPLEKKEGPLPARPQPVKTFAAPGNHAGRLPPESRTGAPSSKPSRPPMRAPARPDEQQELFFSLQAPLPPQRARYRTRNLDTTRQPPLEQRPRDMLRVPPRPRRRQYNNKSIHGEYLYIASAGQ